MVTKPDSKYIPKIRLLLVLILFTAIILTGGYLYYDHAKKEVKQEKFNDLQAIAELKVNQIRRWLSERISEAYFFSENSSFIDNTINLSKGASGSATEYFNSRLLPFKDRHEYENIFICDTNLHVLYNAGVELAVLDEKTRYYIDSAFKIQDILVSDFYKCETHEGIHFDIIAPIFDKESIIQGAVVFRTDPKKYLYPLIQSWPTPSKSSETLIVRRFGDSVVFMNELRHQENTTLNLHFSLQRKDIPAVQAVLGYEGIFEGNDYRNVEVLSFIKQVPRTPWYMIAKVDKAEVYSILDFKFTVVIIVLIVLFALGVMVLAWIYHYHQRNIYRNLYTNEKELSKSQLMLQKSQEIGRLGSWEFDLTDKTLKWSDEVYRILGYKPGAIKPGYDVFLETVHPDDREEVDQMHRQSIRNREEGFDLEHRIIRNDNGEIHSVYTKCDHEKDNQGRVIKSLGMIQDISERKEYEEKLLQQNKEYQSLNEEYLAQNEELTTNLEVIKNTNLELQKATEKAEESDRLKTAFLNNISHEIRTPMNAILGFANLLQDDFPDEEKHKFVNMINNNANQLIKIIDDVIDISMLESNKAALEETDFSLTELFEDLYHTHLSNIDKNKIDFNYSLPDEIQDAYIHADRHKIRQILSGFISNALKYTEIGYVKFGCKIVDDKINFYVDDSGMGIPEDEKNKVFSRFFRGESAQTMTAGGTGLGLSIARELVDLMEGEIGVDSRLNKGSVFYFSIPFKAVMIGKHQNILNGRQELPSALKVLIVEDEEDNQSYLKILMEEMAARIDLAENGQEAVDLCRQTKYDLILMDIKMPVMDGIEATRIIKKEFPGLIVIMQTAYAQDAEKKKAEQAGCDAYLVKPIKKQDLINTIQSLWKSSDI